MTNTEKRINTRYNLQEFWRIKNKTIGIKEDLNFNKFAMIAEFRERDWQDRIPDAMLGYLDYCFWAGGEKVYEIHPNLIDRLMITHLRSVPTELLNIPFDTILIRIPNDRFYITIDNEKLMVNEFITTIKKSEHSENLSLKIAALSLFGTRLRSIIITMDLGKPSIQECLEDSIKSEKEDYDKIGKSFYKDIGSVEIGDQTVGGIVNFITKCLLYITGADSDVEWLTEGEEATILRIANCPNSRRKRIMQAHLDGARRTYKVGYKIVLSREEHLMYDNIKKGLWTLSYRFIVQGHFTHQACGPKHSERKVIFIKPYWKGPEYADIINAPHLVK